MDNFCPPGSTDLIESGSEKHGFLQTEPTYHPLILGVQAATGAHQGPGCQAEDGPAQGSVPLHPASLF